MSIDICAGTRSLVETLQDQHTIIAVDVGFSSSARSTGVAMRSNHARNSKHVTFGEVPDIVALHANDGDVFLILEAPLTMAFNKHGNPIGRTIEKRKGQVRYWYTGLGASVLLASVLLLERIHTMPISSPHTIYLYEGFVTFKDGPTQHQDDAIRLLETLANKEIDHIVDAQDTCLPDTAVFRSSIELIGLSGLPAIIMPHAGDQTTPLFH